MGIIKIKINKIVCDEARKFFKKFYAGEIIRPCDEDCMDGCLGLHKYELPVEYPPLFKSNNKSV